MERQGKEIFAAGLGCAIADSSFNTFATACTKLQLHKEYYKPSTVSQCLRQTALEDGFIRGLALPGLQATVLRSFTYVGFRIGLYPSVKRAVSGENKTPRLKDKIIAGCITGGIGSALFCPIDIVRLTCQADAGTISNGVMMTGLRKGKAPRFPKNVFLSLLTIARSSGVKGLYKGASPTIARATFLSAGQLASYDSLKEFARERLSGGEENAALHVVCSVLSGLIAQSIVQPFDVMRSYFMAVDNASLKSMAKLARVEGFGWFYRGYLAALCRQGPIMLIQMPLIEHIRVSIGVGYM
tara:strand:- start:793 stop:1686 length:894 start_codon:yes stop_codon:yes gene_type:complete